MATVDILDWSKKKVGSIDLDPKIFEVEVRKDILHRVVNWQLACRRQGTHATKTRGTVSGGGKKPFKQKGTGNARQGSSRSPLMPGGAILFGPQPRDYSYNLPKKLKRTALKSALSYLHKEGKLFVVKDMKSEGKTNELAKRLAKFGIHKAVLLDGERDELFFRASKNLPTVKYNSIDGMNVYDLLKYDTAIVTEESIQKIVARCQEAQ